MKKLNVFTKRLIIKYLSAVTFIFLVCGYSNQLQAYSGFPDIVSLEASTIEEVLDIVTPPKRSKIRITQDQGNGGSGSGGSLSGGNSENRSGSNDYYYADVISTLDMIKKGTVVPFDLENGTHLSSINITMVLEPIKGGTTTLMSGPYNLSGTYGSTITLYASIPSSTPSGGANIIITVGVYTYHIPVYIY